MNTLEARRFIDRIDGYVHMKCEVAAGVVLPGHSTTFELLDIPNFTRWEGLRTLDIGPTDGCSTFRMERLGARDVFALDVCHPERHLFRDLHTLFNSASTFVQASVYEIPILFEEEYFDFILFAGVFYHLRHPLLAIDGIWQVLKLGGGLVIETATMPRNLTSSLTVQLGDHATAREFIGYHPYNSLNGDHTNQFEPSMQALKGMFESSGFVCPHENEAQLRSVLYCTKIANRYFEETGYRFSDSIKLQHFPLQELQSQVAQC